MTMFVTNQTQQAIVQASVGFTQACPNYVVKANAFASGNLLQCLLNSLLVIV